MAIINTPSLEQAKKQIKEEDPPIIVKAQDPEFNRKILEYGKFDMLIALDKPLNHIQAKIATKNKIAIGLDLDELKKLEKKKKATILSVVIQNLKILRKAKTKARLLNYKEKRGVIAFLISLGSLTWQTKSITN